MSKPIFKNNVYRCSICNKELQLNKGGFLICPNHPFEEFGKPQLVPESIKQYQSYDDKLVDWAKEHWDDI